MRIKKGDMVFIIAGKNFGKTGKVVKVFPSVGRVSVEGLNMYKKHVRPRKQGEKGEIVTISRPLHVSNVQLICPKTNKPTRIGCRVADGKKERVAKRSGAVIGG